MEKRVAGAETERARGRARGFTLLEVIMAATIMTFVVGVGVFALIQGNRIFSQGMKRTAIDEAAGMLMNKIITDLRQAGASNVFSDSTALIPFPTGTANALSTITVKKAIGWDENNSVALFSQPITWAWNIAALTGPNGQLLYKSVELPDGQDNNGNGLVDEGYVTRTDKNQPSGEQTQIIAVDVLSGYLPNLNGTWTQVPLTTAVGTVLAGNTNLLQVYGFRFERTSSPYMSDEIIVTIALAGQLEDGSIYARQIVEHVLLRN
jgi:hypothetical protein